MEGRCTRSVLTGLSALGGPPGTGSPGRRRNAGADWIDAEVVVDGKRISSRKPDDLPAFNREITKLFCQLRQLPRMHA
jgi:putative intracellular protease/amidase